VAFGVPTTPTLSQLRRLAVGQPMSGAIGRRWAHEIAYQLGYNVAKVASVTPKRNLPNVARTINLCYVRAPGCLGLRIGAEVYGTTDGETCEVDAGASDWIYADGLDGSRALIAPVEARTGQMYWGVKDADIYDVGDISTVSITHTPTTSGAHTGLARVVVHEVPLALTDPQASPAQWPSFNAAWPLPPGGRLVDGTADTAYGFQRVVGQLAVARALPRHQWQIAQWERVGDAWSTTSDVASSTWWAGRRRWTTGSACGAGTATRSPTRGTSTCATRARRRGRCASSTTPKGGSGTNHDYVFAANAGSFTLRHHSTAIDLPTSGTDQECKLNVQCKLNTAGTLHVSTLALPEYEL
jgi:hypothetical protein